MRFQRDLSFALRTARQNPVFTGVVVATLALGIGLTTSIFSIFYAVLLKPLPFPDSGRLVLVTEKLPQIPTPVNLPPAQALELSQNPIFSASAMFISSARNLENGERPKRISVLRASATLLPVLGLTTSRGRAFTEQEDVNGVRVALISTNLEKGLFNSGNALGKRLLLDGISYTIVGVLPPQLAFPMAGLMQSAESAGVWVPLSLTPAERAFRNPDYSFSLIARLRHGFAPAQAQVAAAAAIRRIVSRLPPEMQAKFGLQAAIIPLKQAVTAGSQQLLILLVCAAAALLLIACMNVSNMLLNRALVRRRELALRLSLGADGRALTLQLLTETLFLFLCGGAAGVLCAIASQQSFLRLLPPDLPRLTEIHINGAVLALSLLVSLSAGLAFGLLPAMSALRTDLAQHLGSGSRTQTAGRVVGRARQILVVAQLALAFVLLTAAGLLLRSFSSVLDREAALRTNTVLSFGVALPKTNYATAADGRAFDRELSRRLESLPDVLSVGSGTDLPLENKSGRLITPEHATLPGNPIVYNTDIAGVYLQSLGLRLLSGRYLGDNDSKDSESVAIVNQAFGRAFWSNADPLGYRFKFGPQTASGPWVRIVGVVADSGARAPDKPSEPRIYVPLSQDPYQAVAFRETWFVLRTARSATSLKPAIERTVHSLDSSLPVVRLRSLDQVASEAIAPRSANTLLIVFFSCAALLLSSLGIYGVVAQSMAQRTRELGIRIALGANRTNISTLVLWEGGRLALSALAAGLPLSFAAADLLRSLLFGVAPDDSLTRFAVTAAILFSVFASLLVPIWRATRVDPQAVLHEG